MPTEEMQRSGEAHRMVVEHQERKALAGVPRAGCALDGGI